MDFQILSTASTLVLDALRNDERSSVDLNARLTTVPPSMDTSLSQGSSSSSSHGYIPASSPFASTPCSFLNPLPTYSHSIPFPPPLTSSLSAITLCSFRGLLPGTGADGNLVYLTVDNLLYIWSPTTSTFLSFTGLKQPIISVSIHPVLKNVFLETVSNVLLLTTPSEVMLLAVATNPLRLIPTKFILPADNIRFVTATTTPEGTIFMGTAEGEVYERNEGIAGGGLVSAVFVAQYASTRNTPLVHASVCGLCSLCVCL